MVYGVYIEGPRVLVVRLVQIRQPDQYRVEETNRLTLDC